MASDRRSGAMDDDVSTSTAGGWRTAPGWTPAAERVCAHALPAGYERQERSPGGRRSGRGTTVRRRNQQPDPAMGRAVGSRSLDQGGRVRGRPATSDRERKGAVEDVDVVLDHLGRQPRVALGVPVALDLRRHDAIHRTVAEGRRWMAAEIATVVGETTKAPENRGFRAVDGGAVTIVASGVAGAGFEPATFGL